MLLVVFFLVRRRDEVVLRVVVDHRPRQDLVVRIPLAGLELAFHERRDLIHIKGNVGDGVGLDVVKLAHLCKNTFEALLRGRIHDKLPYDFVVLYMRTRVSWFSET